ncbi:MAG: WbqC family protein [Bacteroidetes bacterium]|nr:WbqC family protein [Bacteroidota bacterium]
MIYPALYNGPVQYFARLVREKEIFLEQFDHYVKQSYRNRCNIAGANGLLTLSIPVKRIKGTKNLFREVRIDYDTPWNKVHWKSLVAAYAASPFFEYFMDDLAGFYEKPFEFLVDLNAELLEKTLQIIGLDIPVKMTLDFQALTGEEDPRHFIHPKLDTGSVDPGFVPHAYHQVFEERHGFRPNLSILDLLFNEGPNSLCVLKNSLKTSIQG